MGTMTPPPPMCYTTTRPSAGEGRDLLPPGEECGDQSREACCQKYDNGADPTYQRQPCVPAKKGKTFNVSKDNQDAVCAPQSWVVSTSPQNEGSCANAGSLAFPCRTLRDKHSGLCLAGSTTR